MAWRTNAAPALSIDERLAAIERRLSALERARQPAVPLPDGGWRTTHLESMGDLVRAPWAKDVTAPSLPGVTTAERRGPARPATFISDVVVPLCWSAISGLFVGIPVAVIAASSGGDWWQAFAIGGSLTMGGMWAFRILDHSRLLWATEKVVHKDLDGDKQVGPPPEPPEQAYTLTDKRQGHSTIWRGKWPGKFYLLRRFASQVTDGAPFTEASAVQVGYTKFEALRDLFILNGWANWRNPDAHQQGMELEEAGEQVLEQMATTPVD